MEAKRRLCLHVPFKRLICSTFPTLSYCSPFVWGQKIEISFRDIILLNIWSNLQQFQSWSVVCSLYKPLFQEPPHFFGIYLKFTTSVSPLGYKLQKTHLKLGLSQEGNLFPHITKNLCRAGFMHGLIQRERNYLDLSLCSNTSVLILLSCLIVARRLLSYTFLVEIQQSCTTLLLNGSCAFLCGHWNVMQ